MARRYSGGIISSSSVAPAYSGATGVWTRQQQFKNVETAWPFFSGQAVYDSRGSTGSWVCPVGVTSVSVLCVGAGGRGGPGRGYGGGGGYLAYLNNFAVTPGVSYSFAVGTGSTYSYGTKSSFNTTSCVAPGGHDEGDTTEEGVSPAGTAFFAGGHGRTSPSCGGGGAGGYTAAGGNGGTRLTAGKSSGGGGGGGGAGASGVNPNYNPSGGGGSVGIYGLGVNGQGGWSSSTTALGGFGGSGGTNGQYGIGDYGPSNAASTGGGGSCGSDVSGTQYSGGNGGKGTVRIIWPGNIRQFPSTKVGNF